ncbi:MAG: hypothetical protein HC827_18535 [Cyanobacteria bacterium RM1_2_2]|nr:hypothetical protein [Cyanobacteria bacterium RM1_2_2]
MVMLASSPPKFVQQSVQNSDAFLSLFPHRFDYLYAPHPEPGHSPAWQTEIRHPLMDRLLQQGSYLYGVRFGKQTQYCLLDVDRGSPYHPANDPFAIQRIAAVLETIGLAGYLVCTSSYSGGLHLYFPFQGLQNSWELGTAVTGLLENAGFAVKAGLLEVFPNRKSYRVQETSLFNGHRLPLQAGSYLLNRDLEPVWSDRNHFSQQWRALQQQNEIRPGTLKRILGQQRRKYQISGKASKFLNDLNTEIESGWSDHGQTNYLLGRIALRTYVFHHVLEDSPPLEGQALIDQIVAVARSLPGYEQWCRHQHELEHRVSEWASCVENSRYFHYGCSKQSAQPPTLEDTTASAQPSLTWNQQQSQAARERIRQAIANLLNQDALPTQASARFKALTSAGIGGGSLYRHKDLWHPDFLNLDAPDQDFSHLEIPDLNAFDLDLTSDLNLIHLNSPHLSPQLESTDQNPLELEALSYQNIRPSFTNLFSLIGGKPLLHQACSDRNPMFLYETGRKALIHQAFMDVAINADCQKRFQLQNLDVRLEVSLPIQQFPQIVPAERLRATFATQPRSLGSLLQPGCVRWRLYVTNSSPAAIQVGNLPVSLVLLHQTQAL